MPPFRKAATKLVLTDTSSTALVVGGANGASTTGTGGIVAGNAALSQAGAPSIAPLTLRGGGSAGAYTLVNSGVVFKDAAGTEVWRLWGTDSDDTNFNSGNLYIGFHAGLNQPTNNVDAGYFNVGLGHLALSAITTGYANVGLGTWAGTAITTGHDNILIGNDAGLVLTTGTYNICIGPEAGSALTDGDNNLLFGTSAGESITTANENICLGIHAGKDLTTGDTNVLVGHTSAVLFGSGAGTSLTSLSTSVFIGAATRASANANSNEIVIGYNAIGNGTNTATIGAFDTTTHLYTPRTLVNKYDASNYSTLAVSSAGAVTLTATGASAGYSFASSLTASSTATLVQAFLMTGVISPTQLAANTDNWNPTGLSTANVIRVSSDAARDLTGIVAQTSGRIILLYNSGAFDITLTHDATSTAANRFYCPNNVSYTLSSHETTQLRYDGTDTRWTVMGSV